MESFLEYIMLNYTWFLGGAIIILLAIIGSYADKTNFGQGKTKEDDSEKIKELQLEKLKLEQQLEQAQKEKEQINIVQKQEIDSNSKFENQSQQKNYESTVVENQIEPTTTVKDRVEPVQENVAEIEQLKKTSKTVKKEESTLESYEEKYAKFDKAFDELLPKKGFDDGDLLDDIESISLDKTQKIDISEIPNFDDVDLPKIKSLNPVDEDIWKF